MLELIAGFVIGFIVTGTIAVLLTSETRRPPAPSSPPRSRFKVYPDEPSKMTIYEYTTERADHFSLSRADIFAIPDASDRGRDHSDIRARLLLRRVVPLLTARIKSAHATGNGMCVLDHVALRPRAAHLPVDVVAAILEVDPTSSGCDDTIASLLPGDLLLDFVTVILQTRSPGYKVTQCGETGICVSWG